MLSFFFSVSSFNFITNFSFFIMYTHSYIYGTPTRYLVSCRALTIIGIKAYTWDCREILTRLVNFEEIPSSSIFTYKIPCQCLPIMAFYHNRLWGLLGAPTKSKFSKGRGAFFSFAIGPQCPAWYQTPNKYSIYVWVCVHMHVQTIFQGHMGGSVS